MDQEDKLILSSHHCHSRGICTDQQMMISLAYVLISEIKQFRLFHAVLQVDATAKTNMEECPLVTVTSKDSQNRMFTTVQAFMPCKNPGHTAGSSRWYYKLSSDLPI